MYDVKCRSCGSYDFMYLCQCCGRDRCAKCSGESSWAEPLVLKVQVGIRKPGETVRGNVCPTCTLELNRRMDQLEDAEAEDRSTTFGKND